MFTVTKDFIFPDCGQQYRVRFVLSDSRSIYATQDGSLRVVPKRDLVEAPWIEEVFTEGAFSLDLKEFRKRSEFVAAGTEFVYPVETIPELAESELDSQAFVLGGANVLALQGRSLTRRSTPEKPIS